MAFIGKLLVVVHGALSLAVLGWATGVFTHRIDWNTPPTIAGKDPPGPGLYAHQEVKIKEYNAAADKASSRWMLNNSQVALLENERYPRRGYYDTMLNMARTGKLSGKDVNNPVKNIYPYDATTGFLSIVTPAGRPAFNVRDAKMAMGANPAVPAVPADSLDGYDNKMKKLVEDIQASQKKNATVIAERETFNKEINGVTQPMLIKGLRTKLAEQLVILERAEAEDVYVVGFVTNREAEFGLLKKRRDAMTARMEELKKYFGEK